MKNKILGLMTFSILFLVLALGVMSAAIDFGASTQALTVEQGSSRTFSFNIENDGGTGNQAAINLASVVSDLTGTAGTIPSSSTRLSTLPTIIQPVTISDPITVTVTIPEYQTPGPG